MPRNHSEQIAAEHDWPDELLPLIRHAPKHGCAYIEFDSHQCDESPAPTRQGAGGCVLAQGGAAGIRKNAGKASG
ncbi:hypothetical protein [Amycolatopsis coloradensis]|uniref:hypothetical protein n=1 Tax=Amycolatopsis coloradensis TaxID=76021 RepID=UPI0011780959|nr:hypothetical protein [Amycolatopsis coloradensis]